MSAIAVVLGVVLVLSVLVDLVNTLVATRNVRGRYWLTRILYRQTWSLARRLGRVLPEGQREVLYSLFAPVSVLGLLVAWIAQQVLGFALIWWGLEGVSGLDSFADAVYYSGVVYFTLGFGEIVPTDVVPRFGALFEAFSGVLTTALVIGYLPALYSAYSQREQHLMMLDDGCEDRITPTSLVLARCPNGDPRDMDAFFTSWESWVAHVIETHTTFPMLALFRSQYVGQNWVTALGVVTDAALHVEIMDGHSRGPSYWMLRRSIRLFQILTDGADLSDYRARFEADRESNNQLFQQLHDDLTSHGFDLLPYDEAMVHGRELRAKYEAELEYLIDLLEAPRGFWSHNVGLVRHLDHESQVST